MNTTHFLNLVMDNVFLQDKDPALPTQYYIGLSTTTPNIDGENVTEPSSSTGYARKSLADVLTESRDGVIKNKSLIDFDQSTDSWGTITNFVIFDAPTGGNLLIYGAISPPRSVEEGTIMSIQANKLTLSLTNPS